jgi:two-component SAPR family response regulator
MFPLTVLSQEYGLSFKGQDFLLDERTSLDITSNKQLIVKDEFELSFDLKVELLKRKGNFGYIFRAINEDNKNIDLLLSNTTTKKLIIVVGDTETIIPVNDSTFSDTKWSTINIKFLLSKNELIFAINESKPTKKSANFKNKESYKLFFGANNYKEFSTSDVPSGISIRDIKLRQENKLIAHYPLNQCGGNEAINIINNNNAAVKNGDWLLCYHKSWGENLISKVDGVQLMTFDKDLGEFYLLNKTALTKYNPKEKSFKTYPFSNDTLEISLDHRILFDHKLKKLYCYLADKDQISEFDFETKRWDNYSLFKKQALKQIYQHHNGLFSPKDNAIYILGGYGQFTYQNQVKKIDLNSKTWENIPHDNKVFKPRYLSGATIYKDSIYILGGYGSESGKQLVNPKSYFDFLRYDIENKTFKKQYEVTKISEEMIFGSSIVIDSTNKNYYGLISDKSRSNGYLKLAQGNLSSSEFNIVADSLPYKFTDTQSFVDLIFDKNAKKLYAYTSFLNSNNITDFGIYSISYPLISEIEVSQVDSRLTANLWVFIIIGVFITGIIGLLLMNYFKKKQIKPSKETIISQEHKKDDPLITLDYPIVFFGGFQMFDEKGNDITGKFTPLLKELFLVLWLYTHKNNKGISSQKLKDLLWYDKSDKSAQNNRAVNITKLKTILKQLGDFSISKKTGYWIIENNSKSLVNDYSQLNKNLLKSKPTKEDIIHTISITKKGAFLNNLDYTWLDSFKQNITDLIVNNFMNYALKLDIEEDLDFAIDLADCIFNFDTTNEIAVFLKCKVYYIKGNHSLANDTFNKFLKEYNVLYGQEFEHNFNEFISLDINNLHL